MKKLKAAIIAALLVAGIGVIVLGDPPVNRPEAIEVVPLGDPPVNKPTA